MNSRRWPAPITLPTHKRCEKCQVLSEIGCFRVTKSGKHRGKVTKWCRECEREYGHERRVKERATQPSTRTQQRQSIDAFLAWRRDLENQE